MKQFSVNDSSLEETIIKIKVLLQKENEEYAASIDDFAQLVSYEIIEHPQTYCEVQQLRSCYLNSAKMLVNFLGNKDQYTKGHCERVTKFTVAIGHALNFSDMDILDLELAAMLHDIGKLAVPDEIIKKEGKLTMQEYEIVKMHPVVGYELIKDISFLDVSKNILLQHHERIDGKGYPHGLVDKEIDIKSKILAVADAYDAMTSSRPYKMKGLSKTQAINQLKLCTGSQFDKNIVNIFIKLLKSGTAA